MSAAVRAFLIWLLAMLAGAVVVWNSHFSADMSFFLPARPSAAQQVLVDQLKEGAVTRLLMVAIEGGDAAQRATVSRQLHGRLEKLPEFVSVQNGQSGSLDADRDFLFRHRYLLSPAVKPERFTVDGLRESIANSVDLLASPAGMMIKPLLPRDPTGEMMELLSGLNAGAQPNVREGVWASRDGERAMLLIQSAALGSDTDAQEQAIATIHSQFADSTREAGVSNARIVISGPGVFAVKSRETIKSEVSKLSAISTLAIIAVLFFVYRSGRLLTLGLLPVVSGTLAGIVAVSLAYGTVFGITVGFGSALIGEAVDYSIYYFVQSGRRGAAEWRARFWPTVRLGVLTSVCGFAALLFSGFPGLAQLGLYSLSGVLVAALVTRFILPALAGNDHPVRDLSHLAPPLKQGIQVMQKLRWPIILLTVAAATILVINRDQLWHPNLSALSTVSADDAATDMALRADIGAPDSRYMAVITAADRESALQAAERAGQQLDALVAQGIIGGYDSPARFQPSQAMQAGRRASLPAGDELAARLQVAQVDSPLAANKLVPFLDEVAARLQVAQLNSPLAANKLVPFLDEVAKAKGQGNITRESLNGTSLALAVDSLLMQRAEGWSVLLPLRPPAGDKGVDINIEPVRAALAGSDALLIDMKFEFDRLGAVLLPLLLAVILVIAGVHLAGEQLHLMHLIGMLLIVAVGSNYALFFDRAANDDRLDPPTLASMAIANLTTAIGFGTLALSSVPVLHAIGVTVGPGAVLALMLAACFSERERE